ncbi:LysE family translocator [Aliiruegeria sabulilitoris]|uniref:LysE family translocator n=1 Tax=Aliiruegeria sabulilitoris TaxID=1510458 RepID=UPI000832E6DC|nr:LysE family translocator [Aliiruegeria sabulilitoris]NDR57509.1 LysE family translocator [Pseudoruegeria sp. M32A2M]
MSLDSFLALLGLAAVAAYTPGPNNALVANSGATFGLRRTLPHILGIGFGFPVMVFLVGFLLGGLFQSSALLREALRWIGAAILLWLAWKIATSGGVSSAGQKPRPFTFLEAAGFQWINPKAWAMAIAVTAQFIHPEAPLATALMVGAVFVFMGLSSAATWALVGRSIIRMLTDERHLKQFNIAMAIIVAGCVVLLFLE